MSVGPGDHDPAGGRAEATPAGTGDRFVPALRTATLPIAVWALHFAALYVGIAAGCWAGLDRVRVGAMALLPLILLAISAAVAIWLAAVVAGAIGHWRRGDAVTGPLVGRIAGAGFALVAVVWETVPVLVLPPCGP